MLKPLLYKIGLVDVSIDQIDFNFLIKPVIIPVLNLNKFLNLVVKNSNITYYR